ncbi:MAG: ATP-dependent RecD-like DNA helicase [Synergistes sp.]|nr:ATP-dependent RecD-like DNA helicase [Synergistes sp.]
MSDTKKKTPSTELTGDVEKVIFHNAENGYTVLRLSVHGHSEPVTAIGNMPEPAQGERLVMRGIWVKNPKYGVQFQASECTSAIPATSDGIEKFLASGIIHGIGAATAKKITEKFKDETVTILNEAPHRLAEVSGISRNKAEKIGEAWAEQRNIREVMIFLHSYGIGTGFAMRIFNRYGSQTEAALTENPYRIASEVAGIGFATADKIAKNFGIEADSPLRIRAGVQFTLNQLVTEGHVYIPIDLLAAHTARTLSVTLEQARAGIEAARLSEEIIVEDFTDKDGKNDTAVYLPAFHYAETKAAENLRSLVCEPYNSQYVDCAAVLPWLEREVGIKFAEAQINAIKCAVNSKVMIITGGPGTGKTTIIRAVLSLREKEGYTVMLAAPTGRAAKRMAEATGHEAKTIHRLLEYTGTAGDITGATGTFMRNSTNRLKCDLLIIDEASMVDIILFHHLLKAIPASASLILVGDVNQLPSVSPGNVLKDLIESEVCPIVKLNEIFRQGKESRIIINAHRINDGLMPLLPDDQSKELSDFYFIEPRIEKSGITEDEYTALFQERVLATIKKLVSENIPRRFNFDPITDIQVLAPMHNGTLGTRHLNAELQKILNTRNGASLTRLEHTFKEGDKIMQTKNNYDKDVYNGDIGTITKISADDETITVEMDTGTVHYEFSEAEEFVHAYAVSIHKSQGSEYPAVVIPLLTQHYVMLQRNLLYTAITRGKKLVVIVGTKKALQIAVRNDSTKVRYTRLAERLRDKASDTIHQMTEEEIDRLFRENTKETERK